MVAPLVRHLIAMETPILAAHDVSMWGYSVLTALCERPYRGQNALADAIGADKTRIIDVLDVLQERGLISREPDPADRRARLLAATIEGIREVYVQGADPNTGVTTSYRTHTASATACP